MAAGPLAARARLRARPRRGQEFVGPRHFTLKAVSIALVAGTAYLSLATDVYRARARAQIQGETRRLVSAPFDGFVRAQFFLAQTRDRLPMERVHFVNRIPFPNFVSLMQVAAAHVYLTYPFVLSWSLLQAMSAGAAVIASNTAPVLEVIEDGVNGLVVDFFATEQLAQRVIDVLAHPRDYAAMRAAARRTIVENYDLKSLCLPRWLQLLGLPAQSEP